MNDSAQAFPAETPGEGELTRAIRKLTPHAHILKALQLIIDAHTIISVTDKAGRIVYVNERFCAVTKYARDELLGQTHRIIASDYHEPAFYEEIWSTISSGETWSGEIRNRAKDGSLFWVQSTISPIFDKNNKITGYASIRTDVTAQRELVAELKSKEKEAYSTLIAAMDAIDSSLSVVDGNGRIVATNNSHGDMYPESIEEEIPGQSIVPVIRKRRPDLSDAEFDAYVRRMFTENTTEKRPLGDGRTVQVRRTLRPGGGYISLHTDITDIVENTELLKQHAATMDLMKVIATDANESTDVRSAYASCLERICHFTGWEVGHVYLPSETEPVRLKPAGFWHFSDEKQFAEFREFSEKSDLEVGIGLPGRVYEIDSPAWVKDCSKEPKFPRSGAASRCGIVGGVAFPVKIRDQIVAIFEFYATRPLEPNPQLEELLSHVCAQMSRVAERDRAEKMLVSRVTAELRKRDQELVEQNERFDAALKNMTQGLCMYDAEQRLIVSNQRYADMYELPEEIMQPGITLRQILEHRIANGIYAGDNPEEYIRERMEWVSSGVHSSKIQYLSDGRSIAITHQPMTGGGWVTTHEDVTERMNSEKALQESQELLSKAFRSSPAAIAISNPRDGAHLDVNESWTTMLGYTREEAMATSAVKLGIWANPGDRDRFVGQISASGSVKNMETSFVAKDGSHIHVLVSGERVEVGGQPRLLVVTYDITERVKADRALKESQKLVHTAFRSSPVALTITSPDDGRRHDVNDAWCTMFGFTREEALAKTVLEIGTWKDTAGRTEFVNQVMEHGSSRGFEAVFRTKDGRFLDVLLYGERVEIGGQGLILTVSYDITERKKAEEALRESQEMFSKAFSASPASVAISDPKSGALLDVNDSWTEMLGYSRETATATTAIALGIWQDPGERDRFVDEIRNKGSAREYETKLLTSDGRVLDVLLYGEHVEVGGVERLLVVSHDITERKKAAEALRESESRFKTLVESTNVVPWEFDPTTMRFTYIGPQAAAQFGHPVEDWYQEDFWASIIHPDDRELTIRSCIEATAMCEDHDIEYRMLTADGNEVWVRDVVSVISEEGKPTSLRGVLIDISERKKARELLIRSEQRFKDIAEVSSDWIWECDEQLRFTYLSERFDEVTGVPGHEIIGKTRHEVGQANDADADWDAHMADLMARRPFRDFRYSVLKEGSYRHWTISGRPVFDPDGNFKGYRGTGADRTAEVEAEAELIRHRDHLQELVNDATAELKQRAEELKQALAKEKEMNEIQRQFVSMASHEFRTPLAIIDSAAQRLQRRSDSTSPEDTAKRVEKIRSAVGRMTQLMESTLVAARLEAGQTSVEIKDCDIAALLTEICERQQDIAQDHRITCTVDALPGTVRADGSALEQVFTNLLSNAVKYAPEAPDIEVRARMEDDQVVVDVADRGVGIDGDDLPKMFQRFFRARTSAGIAGTGIGLNLVKTLVELHDGMINVESEKGQGSTFTVRLPANGPAGASDSEGQAA